MLLYSAMSGFTSYWAMRPLSTGKILHTETQILEAVTKQNEILLMATEPKSIINLHPFDGWYCHTSYWAMRQLSTGKILPKETATKQK